MKATGTIKLNELKTTYFKPLAVGLLKPFKDEIELAVHLIKQVCNTEELILSNIIIGTGK